MTEKKDVGVFKKINSFKKPESVIKKSTASKDISLRESYFVMEIPQDPIEKYSEEAEQLISSEQNLQSLQDFTQGFLDRIDASLYGIINTLYDQNLVKHVEEGGFMGIGKKEAEVAKWSITRRVRNLSLKDEDINYDSELRFKKQDRKTAKDYEIENYRVTVRSAKDPGDPVALQFNFTDGNISSFFVEWNTKNSPAVLTSILVEDSTLSKFIQAANDSCFYHCEESARRSISIKIPENFKDLEFYFFGYNSSQSDVEHIYSIFSYDSGDNQFGITKEKVEFFYKGKLIGRDKLVKPSEIRNFSAEEYKDILGSFYSLMPGVMV